MILTSRSRFCAPLLWRSYTTSLTHYQVPTISTLRPEKLVRSDFLVFAGKLRSRFFTQLPSQCVNVNGVYPKISTNLGYLVNKPDGAKYLEYTGGGAGRVVSEVAVQGDDVTATEKRPTWHRMHTKVPFPAHAQGFLYFYEIPSEYGQPRSASTIRFRCTPSLAEASSSYVASFKHAETPQPDPFILPESLTNAEIYEAFKAGYDLALPDGIPWSYSTVIIAGRPTLERLRTQLLRDELFSDNELRKLEDIYKSKNYCRDKIPLRALDDVFTVRFHKSVLTVWAVTAKDKALDRSAMGDAPALHREPHIEANPAYFANVFADERRPKGESALPYTGAADVRFELAPGSNPSTPALSLRIVKIVGSVRCATGYDGYVNMPKEGELVARGLRGKSKPWICQLDPSNHTHSAMLRLVPGYEAKVKQL